MSKPLNSHRGKTCLSTSGAKVPAPTPSIRMLIDFNGALPMPCPIYYLSSSWMRSHGGSCCSPDVIKVCKKYDYNPRIPYVFRGGTLYVFDMRASLQALIGGFRFRFRDTIGSHLSPRLAAYRHTNSISIMFYGQGLFIVILIKLSFS